MLVWCCIAPHGGELIPELAHSNLGRMGATRAAMEEIGVRCEAGRPNTIVVITPHGVQAPDCVTIAANDVAEGTLDGEDGSRVTAQFAIDLTLTESLSLYGLQSGVSVMPIAFVDEDRRPMHFHLDWGAFIPLWFMGTRWKQKPEIVVLCPSRSLPREKLVDFGFAAAQCFEQSERRIALICSADQGHGHDGSGPYGFAAESAEFDEAYTSAVRDNALGRLLDWDADWIGCAMTDSFWQTLMLHGALLHTPMQPELLSYEVPTYFGMAVASFTRPPNDRTA